MTRPKAQPRYVPRPQVIMVAIVKSKVPGRAVIDCLYPLLPQAGRTVVHQKYTLLDWSSMFSPLNPGVIASR